MKTTGKIKVTLFYKLSGELYAYSENDKFTELFIKTRNMKLFYIKRISLDEYEYRALLAKEYNKRIMMNPLYDGNTDYYIPTTSEEDNELSKKCDEMYDHIIELEGRILSLPWKEDIYKKLKRSTESINKYLNTGSFNTFNVFMKLFGNMFEIK